MPMPGIGARRSTVGIPRTVFARTSAGVTMTCHESVGRALAATATCWQSGCMSGIYPRSGDWRLYMKARALFEGVFAAFSGCAAFKLLVSEIRA
ncbi:hypothetical protein FIV02_19685 [Pseudomonas sp. THAF187a]|nr:hypothetical protein FIV02_19685 [Pseudomonas sp. THAF187a]QFT43980.1 hypothetical protein FIU98_19670 [Pseudomonas sp. THAF42]